LKILVSVVRFRPGPPRFYKPPSGGFFVSVVCWHVVLNDIPNDL